MNPDPPACRACRCEPYCGNISAHVGQSVTMCQAHRLEYALWLTGELSRTITQITTEEPHA